MLDSAALANLLRGEKEKEREREEHDSEQSRISQFLNTVLFKVLSVYESHSVIWVVLDLTRVDKVKLQLKRSAILKLWNSLANISICLPKVRCAIHDDLGKLARFLLEGSGISLPPEPMACLLEAIEASDKLLNFYLKQGKNLLDIYQRV